MDPVILNLILGIASETAKFAHAAAKVSAEAKLNEMKAQQEFELQKMKLQHELELQKLRLQVELEKWKAQRAEAEAEANRWKQQREKASSEEQWRTADTKAHEARARAEAAADQVLRTEADIRTSEEVASALASNDAATLGRLMKSIVLVPRQDGTGNEVV